MINRLPYISKKINQFSRADSEKNTKNSSCVHRDNVCYVQVKRYEVLTVNDHSLNHEIFIVVSGHNASVIAGQFNGRVDDV